MTIDYKDLIPGIPEIQQSEGDISDATLLTVGDIEPIIWGCNIPYVIDASVVHPETVKKAIEYVQTVTNYTFVPHNKQHNYVVFKNGNGCYTTLGKGITQINAIITRVVTINISRYCDMFAVVHEIGHIIGLEHTMKREDRDDYITVVENNILDDGLDQFSKSNIISRGDFDYKSAMMYNRYAFNKNNDPTILLKKELNYKVGARDGFSIDDVKNINSKAASKKCPAKSKPPPCEPTDITFFDGETIHNYISINGNYRKVSNTLYESYNIYDGNPVVITFNINRWNFTVGKSIVLARSMSNDILNTKWEIYDIDTKNYKQIDRAISTQRDCSWPDLSNYNEKLPFNFLNFLYTNMFTIIIVVTLIVLIIAMVIFDYYEGNSISNSIYNKIRANSMPIIKSIRKSILDIPRRRTI